MIRFKISFFILFTFHFLHLVCQAQSLDELMVSAKKFRSTNPDTSILLANKALEKLNKKPDPFKLAQLYNTIGIAHLYSGNPEESKSNLESGLKYAEKCKNDTLQIYILNNLGLLAQDYYGFDAAINYFNQAMSIAKTKGRPLDIGDTYNNLGSVHMYHDLSDLAISYFLKGIEAYKKEKNNPEWAATGIGDLHANIGKVYYNKGQYNLSYKYYFESLKVFEKFKSWAKCAIVTNQIADLLFEKTEYKKSIRYAKTSLQFNDKENRESTRGQTFFIMGKTYQSMNKKDSAFYYYHKSLEIYKSLGLTFHLSSVHNSLATLYSELKDYKKAFEEFNRALEYNIQHADTSAIALNYFNLASNYYLLNDLTKAKEFIDKSKKLIQPWMNYSLYVDVFGMASTIYAKTGNYKEALEYINIRNIYKDSLTIETKMQQQEEIEAIYQTEKKDQELKHEKTQNEKQKLELEHAEKDKKMQAYQIQLMSLGGLVLLIFIAVVIRSNLIRKRNNKILEEKNNLINKQKNEVEKQKDELHLKNHIIEEKQKEITDSINYAKRIQYSLLAHDDLLRKHLPEYFVLFKPKDIVSGDFYWATALKSSSDNNVQDFYLAVCDCTGHGVPGAFMSLLNISFLNEAINEKNILQTGKVLSFVRDRLIQNMEGGKDGMDAILMKIQKSNHGLRLEYSAAHNSPVLIRKNMMVETSVDKMPVGKGEFENEFNTFPLEIKSGDMMYLYTDGYADQFGGPKGKKLKSTNLNKLLIQISELPVSEQKEILDREFENWRGELEQIDDVCIIGIKF